MAAIGRANVLQKQDTSLDAALTVAHAVWHFAGALLGGRPKKRALTRSLRDLTPVREMGQGKSGVNSIRGGLRRISFCVSRAIPSVL